MYSSETSFPDHRVHTSLLVLMFAGAFTPFCGIDFGIAENYMQEQGPDSRISKIMHHECGTSDI